jgi:hypothetical protein
VKKGRRRRRQSAGPGAAAPAAPPAGAECPAARRDPSGTPARGAKSGWPWIAAGLGLVGAAVAWTLLKPSSFAAITTTAVSADNLLYGVAEDGPVIRSFAAAHFKAYAVENLLPALAILLPGLLLLARGLSAAGQDDATRLAFLSRVRGRRVFLAVLFGLALVLGLAGHFAVVGHYPAVGDEFCYVFGADQLAAGRLAPPSPPEPDHFRTWSIVNDGRWYSKVTIGWPLLLALGRAVRLEVLLGPLLAALSVVLLFLVGETLFGPAAGALAALWGLLTPFSILLAGTAYPHTAAAFFALLSVFLLLKAFGSTRRRYAILAGLALAFTLLIRPADGGVLLLGTLPLMGYGIFRAGRKRPEAVKAGTVLALALAGMGLLAAVNLAQNGHPFVFGYKVFNPRDTWGFGANGHTLLRGLWHTAYSLMRAGAWGVPFVGLFALVSAVAKRQRRAWLLLVPVAGSLALYAGYFTLAGFEYGPRYYLAAYLLALVPAAAGALAVRDALGRRRFAGAPAFLSALALSTVLFTAAGTWPRLATAVRPQTAALKKTSRLFANPPVATPSLVFLRDHTVLKNTFLTRNLMDYARSRHVFVLYLDPEENKKVLAAFPSRQACMSTVDPVSGEIEFVPYVDNAGTAANEFAAGLNYMEFDPRKAAAAFTKALELAPGEPKILMSLARASDISGDKRQAIGVYAQVVQSGAPDLRDLALFYLATDVRELGLTEDALKVYRELAATGRDPSYQARAAAWVEKLAGK